MRIGTFLVASLVSFSAFAQKGPTEAPRFSEWPVIRVHQGRHVPPVLNTPDKRMYRTRLIEGARERVNFAGEWVVVSWGCGTSCQALATVNVRTGEVVWPPFGAKGSVAREIEQAEGEYLDRIDIKPNSRLMVIHGTLTEDEEKEAHHYFVFDTSTRQFTKLGTVPAGDKVAEIVGRWSQSNPNCTTQDEDDEDDAMRIRREEVKFYESGCEFKRINQSNRTWTIDADCGGEGDEWKERIRLTLSTDGKAVTYQDLLAKGKDRDRITTYHRCER